MGVISCANYVVWIIWFTKIPLLLKSTLQVVRKLQKKPAFCVTFTENFRILAQLLRQPWRHYWNDCQMRSASCTATSYECHWKSHYQRLNFLCFFFHYFTLSEDFVKEISKSGVVRGCRSANLEIILSVGNLKMQKLGSRFMPFSVKTAHLRGVNAIHCVHIFSMWHF